MIVSRRAGIITGVIVVLALGSAALYRARAHRASADDPADSANSDSPGVSVASAASTFGTEVAIPVEGAPVRRGTLVLSVTAAGEAAAWRQVTLHALVEGPVQELAAREDQRVAAGNVLVAIDPRKYDLDVAEQEARRQQAAAEFRELTLFDDRITDSAARAERARIARAKSGLDGAEVGLEKAQLAASHARVAAPFAGRISNVKVVAGQIVSLGDELATVAQLDPIKVEVQVLESEVGYLAEGRHAAVTFSAFPGRTFTGRITSINPAVDPQTRTARVTVAIPNPRGEILPGMYARVSLDARRFADRILVPRSAILERDQRTMLFVYDPQGSSGLAKWRYVTTGLQNDSLVEILPDAPDRMVKPGEIVLTDGHFSLIHDAHVRLVKDVREAGGRPQ
ncbi:MAG TPA: efflux RND transporter periplasmic adaptor subunit [Gemmatimonadaceae bacterium]|nr:efflux RND transporter periplasmic adaptor subunit [Gemmatimonadaceae bacterium]